MHSTEKAGTSLPQNWPDISSLIYSINCIELAAYHIEDQDLSHITDAKEKERLKGWLHEIYDTLLECYDRGQEILYRVLTPDLRPHEVNPVNS